MARRIQSGSSFPERMEQHQQKAWHDLSFNHKTTFSMGMLVPLACKEVYPGEDVVLQTEIKMKFAALYLPIMHQCYFTVDHYYITYDQLWPSTNTLTNNGWKQFIQQDPITGLTTWAYHHYLHSDSVWTSGVVNYLGFNAPPGAGTFIGGTDISVLPISAYVKIYDEYYRNDQIQGKRWQEVIAGDNSSIILGSLPDLLCLRRNWPRDYYTSATPTPQQGENVLIPSYATDPETGLYIPQKIYQLDGDQELFDQHLQITSGTLAGSSTGAQMVLQMSSTIRDFRYAAQMTEFLERSMRAGDRYNDYVQRHFGYNPNPLYIDRPVWLGGYTGNVIIQDVLATAESGAYTVGQYAGQANVRDATPSFRYTCPDYGLVMTIVTVYPKASYYSGAERMWSRVSKLDYMWEQFQNIGDQPIKNKEVWFSWYEADIAWNEEIFGYLPIYSDHKYSNDIVSGQMRTLWESFHLGRKFTAASQVALNEEFITCRPDIGRVFVVDAEAGEHEIYVHAYNKIMINRRLAKNALPKL